jgi:hypothetical protein
MRSYSGSDWVIMKYRGENALPPVRFSVNISLTSSLDFQMIQVTEEFSIVSI